MKLNYLKYFVILIGLFLSNNLNSTVKQDDIILVQNKRCAFLYPNLIDKVNNNLLLNKQLKKIKCKTTANYKGYVTTYVIKNEKLYLKSIKSACSSRKDSVNLEKVFPFNYENGLVLVDWYTGTFKITDSIVLRGNVNWQKVYNKEFDYNCKKGNIILKKEFENYKKIQNGIERFNKAKTDSLIYKLIIKSLKYQQNNNFKKFEIHLFINTRSRLVLSKSSNSLYFLDLNSLKKEIKKVGKFDIIYQNRHPIEDHYVFDIEYDKNTGKFYSPFYEK